MAIVTRLIIHRYRPERGLVSGTSERMAEPIHEEQKMPMSNIIGYVLLGMVAIAIALDILLVILGIFTIFRVW